MRRIWEEYGKDFVFYMFFFLDKPQKKKDGQYLPALLLRFYFKNFLAVGAAGVLRYLIIFLNQPVFLFPISVDSTVGR